MAYVKATGEKIKFSEQEMTDCYNDGCGGGDYKMVWNQKENSKFIFRSWIMNSMDAWLSFDLKLE